MNFIAIQKILIWAIPLLFAITLHEVAHGWAAYFLGDKTALWLGRLSLNPIKHIDPLGTIIVPFALLIMSNAVFGWAKPVPIQYANLKRPKTDLIWIALAGPTANLVMACLWSGLTYVLIISSDTPSSQALLLQMAQAGISINLFLMLLNLLPIPPLDGSRILRGLLPNRFIYYFDQIEPYGLWIVIALWLTGILSYWIIPLFQVLYQALNPLFHLYAHAI